MIYQIIPFVALMILGYFIGSHLERKHYRSIKLREAEMNSLPAVASKLLPPDAGGFNQALVMGNVTISVDYFKRFLEDGPGRASTMRFIARCAVWKAAKKALLTPSLTANQ